MVSGNRNFRYTFIIILTLGFAVYILVELGNIMLAGPRTQQNPLGTQNLERGPIYDRNGRILAIQTQQPRLSAWIPSVTEPELAADRLSVTLAIDRTELLQRLKESEGYLVIKRNLNPAETDAATLLIQQGELRGFTIEEGTRRLYPEGVLASHVLGFTGIDNQGLEGIELTHDEYLSPGDEEFGNQIYLTIDAAIQSKTDELAGRAFADHEAEAVMILVLSAKTGDILAWSGAPNFDPNNLGLSTPESRQNRPIQVIFEPGSVFKIFTVASFLQAGGIDSQTLFRTSGGYAPPGISPPITDLNDYGTITAEGIIQFSSNVGAALASDTVTNQDMFYLLRQFGFGSRTGIPLNGEQVGILRDPSSWTNRTKPTIAIGQEIAVTALQMAAAATVFGNNGVLLKPQIVQRIVSPQGDLIYESTRTPIRQVVNSEVSRSMLEYMNTAADFGTGQRARVEGLNISIKTGTAEVVDPVSRGYSSTRFLASSLALFPTENPELIVYIVIDYPKFEIFGGRIAAPIVREAAEFLIPYYGITRSTDEVFIQDTRLRITEPRLPEIGPRVPDFYGLSLRTVLPLRETENVRVEIIGEGGWVVRQTPEPGTPLTADTTITLQLSTDPQDFRVPLDEQN